MQLQQFFFKFREWHHLIIWLHSCSCWMIYTPLFCSGVLFSEDPSVWASASQWNPTEDAINPLSHCTTMTNAGLPTKKYMLCLCTCVICLRDSGLQSSEWLIHLIKWLNYSIFTAGKRDKNHVVSNIPSFMLQDGYLDSISALLVQKLWWNKTWMCLCN